MSYVVATDIDAHFVKPVVCHRANSVLENCVALSSQQFSIFICMT